MPKINDNLKELLGTAPAVGMNIAQGMSPAKAAVSAIGVSLLEKVIGPAGVLLGTFVGVSRVLGNMVQQADLFGRGMQQMRSLEQMQSKFETIFKSATLAKERMRELASMAVRSPYKLDELANASRNLEILTKGAWSSKAALSQLADASAATGSDINDLSFTVGKLYSYLEKGRSIQNIAFHLQAMGAVSGDLVDRLQDMQASGAGFAQTLGAVSSELNKFNGAAAAEMNTLGGLSKRLEEMRDIAARGFGESFVNSEKNSIYASMKKVEMVSPVLREIGKDVSSVTSLFSNFENALKGNVYDVVRETGVLNGLWRAFSGIGVALAAATGVHMGGATAKAIRGIGGGIRRNKEDIAVGGFAGAGIADIEASKRMAKNGSRSFEAGTDALMGGNFAQAAALYGRGVMRKVGGYGLAVKATGAMAAAGAKSRAIAGVAASGGEALSEAALAKVGTKAAVKAGTIMVLSDGLAYGTSKAKAFGKALLSIGSSIPWIGWAIGGIAAIGYGLLKWKQHADEVRAANKALADSFQATDDALKRQMAGVITAADSMETLVKAYEALAAAQGEWANAKNPKAKELAQKAIDDTRVIIKETSEKPTTKAKNEDEMKAATDRAYYERYDRPIAELQSEAESASPARKVQIFQEILKRRKAQAAEADEQDRIQSEYDNTGEGKKLKELTAYREQVRGATNAGQWIEEEQKTNQIPYEAAFSSYLKKKQEYKAKHPNGGAYGMYTEPSDDVLDLTDSEKEAVRITDASRGEVARLKALGTDADINGQGLNTEKMKRTEAVSKQIDDLQSRAPGAAEQKSIERYRKSAAEADTESARRGFMDIAENMQANQRAKSDNVVRMRGAQGQQAVDEADRSLKAAEFALVGAKQEQIIEAASLAAKRRGWDEELAMLTARKEAADYELSKVKEMYGNDAKRVADAQRRADLAKTERDIAVASRKDAEEMANRKLNDLKKSNSISGNLVAGNADAAAYEITEKKKADMEQELYDVRREVIERGGSTRDADKAVARRKGEMKEQLKADAYQKFFDSGAGGTLGGQYQAEVAKRVAGGMDPEKAAREATAATLAANPGVDEMDLAYERQKWDGSSVPDLGGIDQSIDMLNTRKSALEVAKTQGGTKGDMATVIADLARKIQDVSAVLVMKEGGK